MVKRHDEIVKRLGVFMSASLLAPFGPEIWLADGPQTEVIGFRYPTRMAVIRLAGGGLLIWSPVALSAPLRNELKALGEVRYLVAPTRCTTCSWGSGATPTRRPGFTPRRAWPSGAPIW